MPAPCSYDYAVIRVVPRVEREEFVNVGVILSCPAQEFLDARVSLQPERLQMLDPHIDLEAVTRHLDSIAIICRGGPQALAIGRLTPRERFHWLVAPRSTMIQTSAVHSGSCQDPRAQLEQLLRTMVLAPTR